MEGGKVRHLKKQEQYSVVSIQCGRSSCLGLNVFREGFQEVAMFKGGLPGLVEVAQMKACGGGSPYKTRVVPKLGENSNHLETCQKHSCLARTAIHPALIGLWDDRASGVS